MTVRTKAVEMFIPTPDSLVGKEGKIQNDYCWNSLIWRQNTIKKNNYNIIFIRFTCNLIDFKKTHSFLPYVIIKTAEKVEQDEVPWP